MNNGINFWKTTKIAPAITELNPKTAKKQIKTVKYFKNIFI
jgi:hypothetical protein